MDIHANPALLAKALGTASKKITSVIYDSLWGYWSIETKTRSYQLGITDTEIGWNDADTGELIGGMEGSNNATSIPVIALVFAYWLETVEGN